MASKKILVTGATGKQGGALINALSPPPGFQNLRSYTRCLLRLSQETLVEVPLYQDSSGGHAQSRPDLQIDWPCVRRFQRHGYIKGGRAGK